MNYLATTLKIIGLIWVALLCMMIAFGLFKAWGADGNINYGQFLLQIALILPGGWLISKGERLKAKTLDK